MNPFVSFSPGLLLQCREGFESDVAAEVAGVRDLPAGYAKAANQSGYILFRFMEPGTLPALSRDHRSRLESLVFPRQTTLLLGSVTGLPETAKAEPLAVAIASLLSEAYPEPASPPPLADLVMEAPDTNEGKEYMGFAKTFAPHLRRSLSKALPSLGKVPEVRDPTKPGPVDIHVFFTSWDSCLVSLSLRGVTSTIPMGIPRLRFPSAAPSRSTLKLDEAFLVFLDEAQRSELLRPGLTAVDLGACPGGWTYQFTRREMHVTAIDNGAISPSLLATGLVEHLREDGFRYRPRKPVAWMVCDMVEKPARISRLASEWFSGGYASHCIFNLKLPMKSRYAEVRKCLESIEADLAAAGLSRGTHYVLACRHLYHDREEVTCYLGMPA